MKTRREACMRRVDPLPEFPTVRPFSVISHFFSNTPLNLISLHFSPGLVAKVQRSVIAAES